MTNLYLCLTQQHDLWLVALAAVICSLGVWTSLALGREVVRSRSRKSRVGWSLGALFSATSAIWATHFIAMIAFDPGVPFQFEPMTTAMSLVIALMLVGAAMLMIAARPTAFGWAAAGVIGGLAISAMHYTGMNAIRVQGALAWDAPTVVASVLAGVVFATLGALMASATSAMLRQCAPIALILAVCLDHFIAMSAFSVVFDPAAAQPVGGINLSLLAVIVANIAFGIVGLSVAAVWLQTRDHRQLLAEEARMRDLADVSIEGLLICEGPSVVGANQSLANMIGADREALLGRAAESLLPRLAEGLASGPVEVDETLLCDSGPAIPVKIISKQMAVGGKTRTVVAVRDQRERISTEAAMRRLAHEDTLTGLANRLSFGAELTARAGSRRDSLRHFALLMLDLDRFKIVNDTLGHGVGDELLKRVAHRLSKAIGEGDLLARLGGDEFAILLSGATEAADVSVIAERIIEMTARPFLIDGRIVEIGVSVGVAFSPMDGVTTEQLSRSADLALYRAKEEGRGAHRFFEEEMNARMQARRDFEHDLRRAIARQEIYVLYQPQLDSVSRRFDGAEALVRWKHPEKGVISPAEFIPVAEDLGLIGAVGELVLRRACAEAMRWPSDTCVAVNLSPVQLRDHRLPKVVAAILQETGLPGQRLELELTENALLQDDGRAVYILHELRELGVRISMDDFGTGYSSISYLRRFPFDKIKIDQSFVRQLPHDAESMAIVQAVATLGNQLGMKVTAEGVESVEQSDVTAANGCHQLQGYLFSRPIDADSVAALFEAARTNETAAA